MRARKVKLPWTVETHHRNVFSVRVPFEKSKGWEQRFLLSADRHWDNPDSNHAMQREHLEEAMACQAGILDFGDLFCAMQGKYDPRHSKRNVRPEHNVDNYLDALVSTAAAFFRPYAGNWIVVGQGNHESAIVKRCETNLGERLVALMNANGATVRYGGYTGWVKFHFVRPDGRMQQTVQMHYDHGHGGGGPVTKGVIQAQRRAVEFPDANICVSGHVHERWVIDHMRSRISDRCEHYVDTQRHVCLPTYKEEYGDGWGGFHIERGRPPKPNGAAWLVFWWSGRDERINYRIDWAE